jgi:hypothetical protein
MRTSEGLCLKTSARRAEAVVVHSVLQAVVLPAEDVVAVLGVARATTELIHVPHGPLLQYRLTCRRCSALAAGCRPRASPPCC